MKKIAFLFPGQGSQKVGMGQDLFTSKDEARAIFAVADHVTNLPISRLCFEGPLEELTQTINLQPAITVVNLACLALIEKENIKPDVCAGHSLGEYSALSAAGVLSKSDCLKLVFKRGELMHREATKHAGAMSAIVGLSIDQVENIVKTASANGIVAVANHNSAEQIVITGAPAAVQAASDLSAGLGGRAVPLKVSGAWHSPLIQGATHEFREFLNNVAFHTPSCKTLHNVSAAAMNEIEGIKTLLATQLCSPVRWYDTIVNMVRDQVTIFVEIGPGRVLTGLLKKILPSDYAADIFNVFDLKSLEKFLTTVA